MKNFKKIISGLIIGTSAFGFSAFTNVYTAKRACQNPPEYLVQRKINQATPFGPGVPSAIYCEEVTILYCIYKVTNLGKLNIPSLASLGQPYYTPFQINLYILNNWIVPSTISNQALFKG